MEPRTSLKRQTRRPWLLKTSHSCPLPPARRPERSQSSVPACELFRKTYLPVVQTVGTNWPGSLSLPPFWYQHTAATRNSHCLTGLVHPLGYHKANQTLTNSCARAKVILAMGTELPTSDAGIASQISGKDKVPPIEGIFSFIASEVGEAIEASNLVSRGQSDGRP
mgnify:FL=1